MTDRTGCYTEIAMPQNIWLRVKLPDKELASLKQEFPNCDFRQSDDSGVDPQWLSEVDGVFTEETVPDELVQRMTESAAGSTSPAAA